MHRFVFMLIRKGIECYIVYYREEEMYEILLISSRAVKMIKLARNWLDKAQSSLLVCK